jgi:hypothetical protein
MNCPTCGTWNPDDKIHCWRCGGNLPEPVERKRKREGSGQGWLWVVAVLFLIGALLVQCGLLRLGDTEGGAGYIGQWLSTF